MMYTYTLLKHIQCCVSLLKAVEQDEEPALDAIMPFNYHLSVLLWVINTRLVGLYPRLLLYIVECWTQW